MYLQNTGGMTFRALIYEQQRNTSTNFANAPRTVKLRNYWIILTEFLSKIDPLERKHNYNTSPADPLLPTMLK